jgi:hypothetical protein
VVAGAVLEHRGIPEAEMKPAAFDLHQLNEDLKSERPLPGDELFDP